MGGGRKRQEDRPPQSEHLTELSFAFKQSNDLQTSYKELKSLLQNRIVYCPLSQLSHLATETARKIYSTFRINLDQYFIYASKCFN